MGTRAKDFDTRAFNALKAKVAQGLGIKSERYYRDVLDACKNGTLEEIEMLVSKLEARTFNRARGMPSL